MRASAVRRRFRRSGAATLALGVILGMIGLVGVGVSGATTGLEFAAAAPLTYDHTAPPANATPTFGYHDGSNTYVVEQLEGGDYDCAQIVPFFTKIELGKAGSVELQYTFDRFTTGHKDGTPGVGYRDIVGVTASTNDPLHNTTTATLSSGEWADAEHVYATATVGNLGPSSVYVLRVDVRIGCDSGADPKDSTGNLLAHMDADLPGGAQTIPMKSAANILEPDRAKVTVVKHTSTKDAQDFAFRIDKPDKTTITFSLDDDTDATLLNTASYTVVPGEYVITETPVAGWTFGGVVCDNEVSSATTPSVTLTLAADDDVTCTFTNTKETPSTTVPYFPPEIVTTTVPPTTTTLPPTTTTAPPATVAPTSIVAPTTAAPAVSVLGEQLARTGERTDALLGMSALLVAAGAALLLAGRQRSSRLVP